MSKLLRILIIEDSEDDTLLLMRELARSGYELACKRVETAEAMVNALVRQPWDVIIADYSLPHFSGLAALAVLRESGLDLPFLLVSGAIGEDIAIEAVKAGADDYLMKDNLKRLGPAIERELREAEMRRERRRAEAELAQRAAQLALINDIGSQVAAMLELDGVLERAAGLVQASFGYHHVALFLLEGETVRLRAIAGSYQAYFSADHRQPLSQGIIGWVGRHGEKVVANDVGAEPRYVSLIADQTVTQAELCLPIKAGERILGVLDIQSPHLNAFSENDVMAMEALTHQLAVAIENARLYEAAQKELAERRQAEAETWRRNQELALYNQVIAASAAGLEVEAILEIACRELALIFDLPRVVASLFDEAKTTVTVVAEYAAGEQPGVLHYTAPVAGSPVLQYLLGHQAPLAIADAQSDPRLARVRDLLRQRGTRSLLFVPLVIESSVVGVLALEARNSRNFSAEEVSLAWSVADQVAGALAQARLAQAHRLLFTAIEQVSENIVITDTGGQIVYVNPAFERTTGYSRAEVIGQNPRLLKSGRQEDDFYAALWSTIAAGQVWRGRLVNKKKDGSFYTEDATITPVRNESGAIVNYVAVKRDVTRELHLEAQLRQTQKMEAIGRLAGGIAHDFNNLLTVINGHSELLLACYLAEDDPMRQEVEAIKRAGERSAALTRHLLAFSRQQMLQPETLDLNQVVGDMTHMLRRLIGENIDLAPLLEPGLGLVKADEGQIEQVIMNLVVNARDAMPRGGKLTLETANITLDEAYARHHVGVEPGAYVMLAVSDTGVGMDQETLAHIFEPFFTTKGLNQGTGLGLATVHGIVKQSGGHIWVYSEPGRGTTFKVYLPQVEGRDEPKPVELSVAPPSAGSETILLVEDDPMVRQLAQAALSLNGYKILAAADGHEALQLYQQHSGPIQLLVTDVVMPHMSGAELAERLLLLQPEMKVLYVSGYTDNALVHHGILEAPLTFLPKPFTPDSLARQVRAVLDGE